MPDALDSSRRRDDYRDHTGTGRGVRKSARGSRCRAENVSASGPAAEIRETATQLTRLTEKDSVDAVSSAIANYEQAEIAAAAGAGRGDRDAGGGRGEGARGLPPGMRSGGSEPDSRSATLAEG